MNEYDDDLLCAVRKLKDEVRKNRQSRTATSSLRDHFGERALTGLGIPTLTSHDQDCQTGSMVEVQIDDAHRPKQRQLWQEEEVLRVVGELGYDPLAVPKWHPGKPGVKAKVRLALKWEGTIFDKAWERLRKDGRLRAA